MRFLLKFFVAVLTSSTLLMTSIDSAEAKRLGGGSSFGSKFSQSQSVKRTTDTNTSNMSTTQKTNSDRKQQLANKGGLMGMIGALAIGGILGALFFGGAFEGINFIDILLFGLIAFLIFKFISSRARANSPVPVTAGGPTTQDRYNEPETTHHNQSNKIRSSGIQEGLTLDGLRNTISEEFDQNNFIDGAKSCFARLQRAWDEGDLADIRQFTTDHVFGEIQDQHQQKKGISKTEIMELDAELLNTQDLGSKQEAIVLFKAKLTEEETTHVVEEVWHFVKSNSESPNWRLDGIQQVDG